MLPPASDSWSLLLLSAVCFLPSSSRSLAFSETSSNTSPAQHLQTLIEMAQSQNRAILLPGVHDALSARVFSQQPSTECLFLSGFGVSASLLGVPDAGILSLNEMQDTSRRVIRAVGDSASHNIPVMVDGDTGYGGCSNMRFAIRGLAQAGAAAISIEDQVFPKKCTYSAGQKGAAVVSREASLARIKTALVAAKEAWERVGNHVMIVARTDCRAALGLEEAMSRCMEYEKLGADIVYAENLQSPEEYQLLRSKLSPSTPTILAQVQLDPHQHEERQQQRLYSLPEVNDLGYNFALWGVTALQATVGALQTVAKDMHEHQGRITPPKQSSTTSITSFSTLKNVIGFPELEDFERNYYCE
jgi:2-methylisocitrate lyase-like PEP mutase family enzyme